MIFPKAAPTPVAETGLGSGGNYLPVGALNIAGSAWLGGRGVNVYSNGGNGAGGRYQCVELINRLITTLGWSPSIYGNANQIYGNASTAYFDKHANGSGYQPVPGDIVALGGGSQGYGHVAVVEANNGSLITVVQQNASADGYGTYKISASGNIAPTGYGYYVQGFLHAKANSGPPVKPPISADATLPDETRFVQQGSSQQYLSVRGAALPMGFGDAQALDADGNTAVVTVAAGYVAKHASTIPAGTLIRPAGQTAQFVFDGSALHHVSPGVSACLQAAQPLYTVPTAWAGAFPVSDVDAICNLPNGTRFVEQGSAQQYLALLGGALPMSFSDAQAFDADGNTGVVTVPAGYVASHPATLPAGSLVRPVGQLAQYLFDGAQLHHVSSAASACLLVTHNLMTVPTAWAGTLPVSATDATCDLPDGTRFQENGAPQQYLAVLGAALPLSYADALAFNADGNSGVMNLPAGYVASHGATLPAGTVIRPVGQTAQYVFDGAQLHHVSPGVSACLLATHTLYVVPTAWSGGYSVSPSDATC